MALNLEDYNKTSWVPEMPITQDRMDNLETGVKVNRDALKSLDDTVNGTGANSMNTKITNLQTAVNERPTTTTVQELVNQGSGQGTWARTEIVAAMEGDTYTSLKNRFDTDEGKIAAIKAALGTKNVEGSDTPVDAYSSTNTVYNAVNTVTTSANLVLDEVRSARTDSIKNVTYDSLSLHLRNIDSSLDVINASIADINGAAGENNTITSRFAQLDALREEVAAAHRAVEEGAPADTLAARFAAIEAQVSTLISNVSSLTDNKVNVSDIINDLTHTDTNKPLSANMGKTLKDMIGGNYSAANTVASAIAAAQNTAEANANTYTDSLLGEDFNNENTVSDITTDLNDRMIDVEAELNLAHSSSVIQETVEDEETHEMIERNKEYDSIDSRFEAIEAHKKEIADEIAAARVSSTVRTEVPAEEEGGESTYIDTNYASLDARLEAIEAHAAASRNDIDTIANELSMFDVADNISDAHTRIDQIESNVVAMANEIGMLQNGAAVEDMASAIDGATTRIDAIESEIAAAHRAVEAGEPEDTLHARFSELENNLAELDAIITNATTGLAATKAIADANAAAISHAVGANGQDDKGGLVERVATLESEPKSATVIEATLPQTGDPNKDYLIGPNEDGKYFYYKWINNSWNLISGGGSGEGNTSGMDLSAEAYEALESYDENTDYYVTRDDGIHHYRYVPNTISGEGLMEVEIGISENYNIGIGTVTETENNEEVDNTYLYLYKFAPDENSEITDETALPLVNRGTLVRRVKLPATGGGIGAYEQIRIQPATGQSTVFTAVEGNTTPIPLNLQGQKRDQDGYVATTLVITMQYRERGSDAWRTYTQGEKEVSVTSEGATTFSTVDISSLLVLNKTIEIKVTAADKNNTDLTNSSVTFSVTKVELNLTSTFNQSAPYTTSTVAFNYSYTGSGLNKTLYLYLNDTLLTTRNLGTGIGNGSYNIDMSEKAAGTYSLKAYFVTDDSNTSNTLNYSIMYIPSDETLNHPIVGISIPETSIIEGDVLTINYSAYTQNADQTQEILFEIFEEGSSTAYTSKKATNVNNNQSSSILFLDYPVPQTGTESISVTIRATASNEGQTSYSTEQIITVARYSDTSINFDPIDTNLIYEFDPIAHSNNDENRAEFTYSPHSGTTYTTTLEDFNWVSNGYLGDEALTFNGDAVMHIDVPVLITNVAGTDINDTPTSYGRTIEFEYEVNSVTDINAPIITYFNNSNVVEGTDTNTKTGVGFEITPQNCYLISEAKSVVTDKKGFIHNEDDIAAAYLSEGSRLRVSFVIEAVGTHTTGAGNNAQTVNIYINGQYANSCPYDGASELFTVPADADCKITIGNDSSILKLYDVRIYNRNLTETEILQNYTTSPLLRRDKLARIRENDLLTANQQEIDYYKARQYYNCLLITGNLSPAKSEKVSCGLIFTQPNSDGGFDEKFRCMDTFPDGSYTSQNAVQGTSSVKFPVKNYKVYLTSGYELDAENKPKAVKYKYALEPGRVKESTFCWKGDYMSSDHANTFNANWADALETRIDGASHIQNSVYGFRCLLFYRPDAEESTPIVLIGDGTLNNDKGNTKTFQLEDSSDVENSNDTRSQKWEFKNNTETPCLFQSDNLINIVDGEENYTAATEAFESTYPDEGDLEDVGVRPNYNHLQILLSWVLRRANYWDETDENARATKKAIFKNEFTRHFNMDHMLLYYLFCEFTAMTDNRAKNMFIRCDNIRDETIKNMSGTTLFSGNTIPDNQSDWYKYLTGTDSYKASHYTDIDWENSTFGIWTPVLYDLDSCYGVENSGYLQVPYYANWDYRDVADTKYLFNGYGSILWLMFEDSFANEIRTMAQTIYANGANGEPGLNYNSFYKYHITDNALKFPPVIINQDMNKKYLNPWINGLPDPEDSTRMIYNAQYKYLQRGSRTDQKVGFIERRSRMLYSKYLTTQFIANEASVNFRCGNNGAQDTITLTASTACYPAIQFSDTSTTTVTTAQQYANTGESVTFTPDTPMGFSDTVYIRGASMLTGISGIGGYMPYEINLSGGRNLKQLILGSSTIVNTQVSSSALSGLDACSILEDLNIENFNGSSFTTLNLASNRLLKNLYATGANNLGTCSFANGGIIENIELGTGLTNLTLQNQTRIQTLKFGGSNTVVADNVAKINTIFVEGISSQGMEVVQDVFKARLFALNNQLVNGRAQGEAVALGGGVRISGLNMTITCRDENNNMLEEADLLDLLINANVMAGKGLTHDGTLSSTAYPYLSGTLTINRGQDQKVAILRSMYPNLTIIENNPVVSYTVIYQYEDGTFINSVYVDEGSILPDIYANGMIEKPTKARTARETYDFGVIENSTGEYIPYSGWKLSGAARSIYEDGGASGVYGRTVVETVFTASVRTYQVRWYLDEEESKVIKTSSAINYGEGYTLEAPTVKDIHDAGFETCSVTVNGGRINYSLFTGWEKLPTNINPSAEDDYYKIHAVWETNSELIDNMFSSSNLDNLTPEQLLALSGMDAQTKSDYGINSKVGAGTRITYNMGADNDLSSGNTLISSVLQLDSAIDRSYQTDIQPLRAGNDAFTLAIDYCFNPEATQNLSNTFSTLVSCYYSDANATVRNGFSLFYGRSGSITGPRVGFGDMYNNSAQSVMVGNTTNLGMRNMIVLRHPAGEPVLYVYSGLSNSITMPSEVNVTALQWQNYNSDAHLCFGFVGNDAGANDTVPALVGKGKGKIYWAKYWSEDLGQGECKRIASWPHEPITFGIYNYNSSAATTANRATSTSSVASLGLATLNTPAHGAMTQSRVQDSTFSWASSNAYTLENGRVFLGLPTKLQAILCKAAIKYSIGIRSGSAGSISGGYSYGLQEMPGSVRNYVGAYSLGNISTNSVYANEDNIFPWYDATNVTAYTYSATSSWVTNPTDSQRANYTNIRFPSKPINATFKVFRESTDTVPTSTTFMSSIGTMLSSGDICITYAGKAYMYVTTAEASALGLLLVSSSEDSRLATTTGGWIRADEYWTRSVVTNNGFNFSYVHEPGLPEIDTTTSASGNGLKISYLLAI